VGQSRGEEIEFGGAAGLGDQLAQGG